MVRVIAFLLAIAWGQAWAATWHVINPSACALNGNGTAPGCASSGGGVGAWRGSASYVAASVVAGDTVVVTGNFSFAGGDCQDASTCFYTLDSGAVGNPITFDMSAATFNGNNGINNAINTGNGNANLKFVSPTISNFNSRGFTINSAGAATDAINITIENPTITNIQGGGTPTAIWGRGSGLTVKNPRISTVGDDAVWLDGNNAYADSLNSNLITNVGTAVGPTGDCVQMSGSGGNDLNTIWKINCDHRSADEKQCFVSNTIGKLRVIESVCLGTTGLPAAVYTDGAIDLLRNYFSGSDHVLDAWNNTAAAGSSLIVGNIFDNFDSRGISGIGATVANQTVSIAHNAFNCAASSSAQAIVLQGSTGSTFDASNNVVGNCSVAFAGSGTSTKTGSGNADYANVTRFSVFTPSSTLITDPRFVGGANPADASGFCLATNSPLLGAGVYLGAWATGHNNEDLGKPPAIGPRRTCYGRDIVTSRPAVASRPAN